MDGKRPADPSCALPGAPVTITADPTRLRQILLNLLSNAVKFTPEGKSVTLSCGRDGDQLFLRVADTDDKRTAAFKKFTEIFNRDAPGHIITPLDYALVYTAKLQGVNRTAQADFHFVKAWLKP